MKHESFGTIAARRVYNTGPVKLFGSRHPDDHPIEIEITAAELGDERSTRPWVLQRERIILLQLSAAQLAQLIGSCSAVPCTIRWYGGRIADPPEWPDERLAIVEEAQSQQRTELDELRLIGAELKALEAAPGKRAIRDLATRFERALGRAARNYAYYARRFVEITDAIQAERDMEVKK